MQSVKVLQAIGKFYSKFGVTVQRRSASNHKRSQLTFSRDQLEAIKTSLFEKCKDSDSMEWHSVRNSLISKFKHINSSNVDAIVLGWCNTGDKLLLAKDYIRFLNANKSPPNAAAFGRLLRVYNSAYHMRGGTSKSLTTGEQREILNIYKDWREKHDVLDAASCENLIFGLVTTSQWLDCLELLKMTKLTATPSVSAYAEVVIKAFHMDNMSVGWPLLNEMLENQKQPICKVYIAYLDMIAKKQKTFLQEFENMLLLLAKYEIVITQEVVNHLNAVATRFPKLFVTKESELDSRGKCSICHNHLHNVSISEKEFKELSDLFLEKVLIRDDVFKRSSPSEVTGFKKFVEVTAPYDCVIDGLNVAYSAGAKKSPPAQANLLAAVVKYFKNKRKAVLVLGRQHMNKWPKDTMQYIRKNASVFLTNNLTHDDPFMLYATLKSGPMTDFFSRDLMRSHAFQLGPELKTIFRRWQQEHQYSLITKSESGRILVKEPVRHLLYSHRVKNTWHLPYKSEYTQHPPETFEVPQSWLCIEFIK